MRALPLGAEVETGRKHDRRLGKEGTFLFRRAFYPDGQKNGSKRRRLAAEPKIEPCQEIRTSRKQHVLTADQWRNVRNRDADGSFHPRCETKSPSFGAPRWGPVPGPQGQTDHQGTWQLTAWIAGCPVIIKKCSSPLIFPDQIDSKFSITAPSAEQQPPSPSSPEMPRLWRQPPCGPQSLMLIWGIEQCLVNVHVLAVHCRLAADSKTNVISIPGWKGPRSHCVCL